MPKYNEREFAELFDSFIQHHSAAPPVGACSILDEHAPGLESEQVSSGEGDGPSPSVAKSRESYPSPAGTQVGPGMEALILAESFALLSRAIAYTTLSELQCGWKLEQEIRKHLDALRAYAVVKGIGLEVAEAMLHFLGSDGLGVEVPQA